MAEPEPLRNTKHIAKEREAHTGAQVAWVPSGDHWEHRSDTSSQDSGPLLHCTHLPASSLW